MVIEFVHHCRRRKGSLDDYAAHLLSVVGGASGAMFRASDAADLYLYVYARDTCVITLARLDLLDAYRARERGWPYP